MTNVPALVIPTDAILLTLPFYDNTGSIDEFPDLKALHYDLIDVEGDGNCGIYCIILGLISRGSLEIPLANDLPKLVLVIRKALYATMKKHGEQIIANLADDLQLGMFGYCAQEWKDMLRTFHNPRVRASTYRSLHDHPELQVAAHWLPLSLRSHTNYR